MLNLIVFFLFPTDHEEIGAIAHKTVIIEERVNGHNPQLHLRVQEEKIFGELARESLSSFKKNLAPLLQIFLYPRLGYNELFQLLDMERDPWAIYKFQKLMVSILVKRINRGCIESNEELCCYLFSRYNTCSYESGFVDKLRAWRAELTRKHNDRTLSDTEQCSVLTETLPQLSKQGKVFLQKKSGVMDRQLSEKELVQEYSKLPEPLKCAVCVKTADGRGGRTGFDMCIEQLHEVSLSSIDRQPDPLSPRVFADQVPQAEEQRASSWFGVSARAVGYWIARTIGQPEKQERLKDE